MKKEISLFIFALSMIFPALQAQPSLLVEGTESSDTVVKIIVTSDLLYTDIVALYSRSEPSPGRGIGGSFYGGITGLMGESHSGTGILAKSDLAYGVRGISTFGYGGYFKGGGGIDLVLAGTTYGGGSGADEGVISTDPLLPSSDMWLVSNDAIVLQLDKDDDEAGAFEIKNSDQSTVFSVDEAGNTKISGELQTYATGSANMLPICYGNVRSSGLVNSGTGNFTINKFGPGLYRIDITNQNITESGYLVLLTLHDHGSINWFASAGDLSIMTFDNGINTDKDFCFLVYKP